MKLYVEFGTVFVTRAVQFIMCRDEADEAIARHSNCDWGEVSQEQRLANDHALVAGCSPIQSGFRTADGIPFLIITKADRSATFILRLEDLSDLKAA